MKVLGSGISGFRFGVQLTEALVVAKAHSLWLGSKPAAAAYVMTSRQ